jgi:hypothetical protein
MKCITFLSFCTSENAKITSSILLVGFKSSFSLISFLDLDDTHGGKALLQRIICVVAADEQVSLQGDIGLLNSDAYPR